MVKRERIIRKTKTLTCGHEQRFSTPIPRPGEVVCCLTCNNASKIPPYKRKQQPWTVAAGRPRRLKVNPRSNNQFTKGRALN